MGVMATFWVHAWASPVSSLNVGAVSPADSSVRVRVAVLSVRPLRWSAKAMTSAALAGIHR